MPWSITIARVAGSEIRIHLTFLILLAWRGVSILRERHHEGRRGKRRAQPCEAQPR